MGILRIYLAISVVLHHCQFRDFPTPTHMDGGVSVLLFFIISGFYITLILNEKYNKLSNPIQSFYMGRAIRIFPLYLTILLFAIIFFRSINQPSVFTDQLGLSNISRLGLVLSNIFIVGQDVFNIIVEDIRNGSPLSKPLMHILESQGAAQVASNPVYVLIGQAWSLSIELLFYLFAPFIVCSQKRVLILIIASALVRTALYFYGFSSVPYAIRFFPSVLVFFLLGSISYFIYRELNDRKIQLQQIGAGILAISVIFAVAAAHRNIGILNGADFDTPTHWALYIAITVSLPFLFSFTRESKIDNFIGEFSYPIYLVHGLVLGYMVQPIKNLTISGPMLVVGFSMFFSWLLIYTVVKPCNKIKTKQLQKKYIVNAPARSQETHRIPIEFPQPLS